MAIALVAVLLVLAFGGAVFAFAGSSNETAQKRIAGLAKAQPGGRSARATQE